MIPVFIRVRYYRTWRAVGRNLAVETQDANIDRGGRSFVAARGASGHVIVLARSHGWPGECTVGRVRIQRTKVGTSASIFETAVEMVVVINKGRRADSCRGLTASPLAITSAESVYDDGNGDDDHGKADHGEDTCNGICVLKQAVIRGERSFATARDADGIQCKILMQGMHGLDLINVYPEEVRNVA